MAAVGFHQVEKSYGSFKVIHGIDAEIQDGSSCAGRPSGCGKSTLLRSWLGWKESAAAKSRSRPCRQRSGSKDRDIAMVFQSYGCIPT